MLHRHEAFAEQLRREEVALFGLQVHAEVVDRSAQDRDRAVAELAPVCRLSGRCCRFEEYGHTLFLSAAEAAVLIAELDAPSGATVARLADGYLLRAAIEQLGARLSIDVDSRGGALEILFPQHRYGSAAISDAATVH